MFYTPFSNAQLYIGTVCLNSTVLERETGAVSPETFLVKYDVVFLGGSSYSISGHVDIPEQPFIFTGYGNLIGSELYMNVTTTQSHPDKWQDTGINQTQLNLATMTGSWYEIGNDFNTQSKTWDKRYTAGTVAKTSCL